MDKNACDHGFKLKIWKENFDIQHNSTKHTLIQLLYSAVFTGRFLNFLLLTRFQSYGERAGGRQLITLVCLGLLTPNLVYM